LAREFAASETGIEMIGIDRRKLGAGWMEQGGLAAWLVKKIGTLRGKREKPGPRLSLVERIALAPRQSLALVEAEGRRFLVATSHDSAPAFLALDQTAAAGSMIATIPSSAVVHPIRARRPSSPEQMRARVSW
jgi:flagellar biogenesis protein FliO